VHEKRKKGGVSETPHVKIMPEQGTQALPAPIPELEEFDD